MTPTDLKLQTALVAALASPFGIEIFCSSPAKLRARIYALRKTLIHSFPDLALLSIATCPTDPQHKLWILKLPKKEEPDEPSI